MRATAAQGQPFALSRREQGRLSDRLGAAVRRARRSGHATLASVTVELPAGTDPTAVACASRRPGEPWFCFEQPDHGSRALGALGEALELRNAGPDRFAAGGCALARAEP